MGSGLLSRAPSSAASARRAAAPASCASSPSSATAARLAASASSGASAAWPLAAARSRRCALPSTLPRRGGGGVAAATAAGNATSTPWSATTTRRRSVVVTAAAVTAETAPARPKVLIAPAFYLDAAVFRPLCRELRARGFDAALPSIRWHHWTPTLGGRSQRPILDRLDWALEDLCAPGPAPVDPVTLELPARGAYGPLEFLREMRDPSQGARPLGAASLVPEAPLRTDEKAAVVASSAGGWICRILLAGADAPAYGGRSYEGAARRAHTLVTLGTPHYSSEPVTRRNIDWVNQNAPGCFREGVRYAAVGAGGTSGRELVPGAFGDFCFESYKLCSGDGKDDGDGVTPLRCALALEGAAIVKLDGAAHTPPLFGAAKKADWYGEGDFLEAWVGFLKPPPAASE